MKSKLLLVSLIFSIAFVSCKDDVKKDVEAPKEEKSKTYDVVLNMVVTKDDSFQLFYTDEATQPFDDTKSIWIDVKGAPTAQDIVFKLPEGEVPANVRLDLGVIKTQPEMKFNSLTFKYFDKSFQLKGAQILTYFVPGQFTFDKQTLAIKTLPGDVYDPQFYPQSNLSQELTKIIK